MEDLVIVWISRDLHKKLNQQKAAGDFKTIREVISSNYDTAHKEKNQ